MLPPYFGSSPGIPDTNADGTIDWSPRRDLEPSGFINIIDVSKVLPPVFGSTCEPPSTPTPTPTPTPAPALTPTPTPSVRLKIGVLLPFTGDLSTFGPALLNGANLAAQHINSAGGVLGQPIEIVTGDTGTDPAQGISEATRLIDVEGVSAIVGAAASGVTLPVAESVTIPSQVVLISPASTSPGLTTVDDDDYLFRTAPSDAMQAQVLAQLAVEQGFETACTMFINNAYGQGLSDEFTQSFEALGGQVLAAVPHESPQVTYASELATCTQDDPDVLVALSYPESGTVFITEAIANDLVDSFLFSDGLKSPDMVVAVEVAVGSGVLDGMFGTAPAALTSGVFDSEYEAEYGEPPLLPFIGEAYSAVALLALAAEEAASTNSSDIRDSLRQVANAPGTAADAGSVGLAQALQAVRDGAGVNYLGHTGVLDLDFDLNGDVTAAAIEVWTIQGSQIVTVRVDYVGPAPAATPTPTPAPAVTPTPPVTGLGGLISGSGGVPMWALWWFIGGVAAVLAVLFAHQGLRREEAPVKGIIIKAAAVGSMLSVLTAAVTLTVATAVSSPESTVTATPTPVEPTSSPAPIPPTGLGGLATAFSSPESMVTATPTPVQPTSTPAPPPATGLGGLATPSGELLDWPLLWALAAAMALALMLFWIRRWRTRP